WGCLRRLRRRAILILQDRVQRLNVVNDDDCVQRRSCLQFQVFYRVLLLPTYVTGTAKRGSSHMRLQDRFRRTCAIIVLSSGYKNKRDALANALRTELRLHEKADLRPLVTRYLRGEVASSGFFEVIHVIFMRSVVVGDYPPHFLIWLDRAYGSYDLCASG